MTIILSLLGGFSGGLVAWFCSNYLGRPLIQFWELRSEAHTFLYYYANMKFDRPPHSRNAEDAQNCFRWLGVRVDTLRTSSLRLIMILLGLLGYNLEIAATSLIGLSNTLASGHEQDTTNFRVQAQQALQLPIDPEDQETFDRWQRIKDVSL